MLYIVEDGKHNNDDKNTYYTKHLHARICFGVAPHIQALSNLRIGVGEGLLGVYHHAMHGAVIKLAAGVIQSHRRSEQTCHRTGQETSIASGQKRVICF